MRRRHGELGARIVAPDRGVSKRLRYQMIERLVAEYVAGTTAAELGRRHGLAKSKVLRLVRQAGERVRHQRLSRSETARLVQLYRAGRNRKTSPNGLAKAPAQCGIV